MLPKKFRESKEAFPRTYTTLLTNLYIKYQISLLITHWACWYQRNTSYHSIPSNCASETNPDRPNKINLLNHKHNLRRPVTAWGPISLELLQFISCWCFGCRKMSINFFPEVGPFLKEAMFILKDNPIIRILTTNTSIRYRMAQSRFPCWQSTVFWRRISAEERNRN